MAAVDTFKIGVGASQRATSLVDGATGIIAIVLTILGLLRLAPTQLVAIATIAAGVGVFAQGLAVARGYAKALSGPNGDIGMISASGWALTFLAGVAGVILGILALLGLASIVLVAIAAIVLGGSTILRTHELTTALLARALDPQENGVRQLAVGELVANSAALQALIGLSAAVLGILSLAGFVSLTLDLIAFLALGSGLLLSSAAFGGLMTSLLRRG